MSGFWHWLTWKFPEPTYRYLWTPLIPFFTSKLSIDTLIGLVTAIAIGSCGILLFLRQRNQPNQQATRRLPAIYKWARAAIFGVVFGIVGSCLYLIVALILIDTQQTSSGDAIAILWSESLLGVVLGFLYGSSKPTRRKEPTSRFWMFLGASIIAMLLLLVINAGAHSGPGTTSLFVVIIFLAIAAQYWDKVSTAVQRHSKACAIFLISSAVVLIGVTVVLQIVASATSG